MAALGQPAAAPAAAPASDPTQTAPAPPAETPAPGAPAASPQATPAAPDAAADPVMAQLQPMLPALTPLLQPDDQGATPLEGLVNLYELFSDENRIDDLAQWWDEVGEQFGFFGDDEDGEGGAAAPDGEAEGEVDLSDLDPAVARVIQSLQAKVEQLEGGLTSQQQEQQASAEGERIRTELVTAMKGAGIDGHEDIRSEQSTDILRMALGYGNDPEAIKKSVERYAQLTGARAPVPEPGVDPQLGGVAALQAALGGASGGRAAGPGPSLGRGNPEVEPEAVTSWNDARTLAMQRMRESG